MGSEEFVAWIRGSMINSDMHLVDLFTKEGS